MIAIQAETPSFAWDSSKRLLFTLVQVIGATLFIALCSQIRIPLFFTPIPITGQTFAMMLIGALFGSQKGTLTVLLYLTEGACGLPVFSHGSSGLLYLFGPSCGYFLGFVVQTYIVGFILERQIPFHSSKVLAALLFSTVIQLSLGMLGLAPYIGIQNMFWMGFLPFIPGEILKAITITSVLKSTRSPTIIRSYMQLDTRVNRD